nr:TetR/AcrR family transcriptional regulator [Neobacillus sp. Marseille-Q6967]
MNDRKQHVIKKAHQLFVEKGYQATSIQDILDFSGISKGTFYNYFSSKSELLIAIYKSIYKQLEKDRNDLLVGQDPSNIEIFKKQLELQMVTNKKNKLIALYEEVMATNDVDLKQFIQRSRLRSLRWMYGRFIDLFGQEKRAYLLDCAIMFTAILQHNLQYSRLAYSTGEKINQVVTYSVARLVKLVRDVSESQEQLLEPELLEKWMPGCENSNQEFFKHFLKTVSTVRQSIKKNVPTEIEQEQYTELLDFIQEEILHTRSPRKFLIQSAFCSLKANPASLWSKDIQQLQHQIEIYFEQNDNHE